VNEKRRVYIRVASFTCDDAQFDDVADGRKHVTFDHVVRLALASADAGVDRVGSLLDDGVATRRTRTRRRGRPRL